MPFGFPLKPRRHVPRKLKTTSTQWAGKSWHYKIQKPDVRIFPITVRSAGTKSGARLYKCEDYTMSNEADSNLTPEQMAARIAELESRLAKGSSLSFKVSEKGAVSVYGLGRFPVTLYLEQWEALLSHATELREFIEANRSRLKTKDQTKR